MPADHEPAENTHLKMAKALKFKAFVGWVVETRRFSQSPPQPNKINDLANSVVRFVHHIRVSICSAVEMLAHPPTDLKPYFKSRLSVALEVAAVAHFYLRLPS